MLSMNSELRLKARRQLNGNWGTPILVCFLYFVVACVASVIPALGPIISLLITGPLVIGLILFAIRFSREEKPEVGVLFEGFNNFGPALGLYLWNALWVCLWMLLLIIPGFIKSISYSMSFYILADNPKIGVRNAMNISKVITNGYKGKIFLLGLSFIGWALLACLTLGIGLLWLAPYIQVTFANFYNDLKTETVANGKYAVVNPVGQGVSA